MVAGACEDRVLCPPEGYLCTSDVGVDDGQSQGGPLWGEAEWSELLRDLESAAPAPTIELAAAKHAGESATTREEWVAGAMCGGASGAHRAAVAAVDAHAVVIRGTIGCPIEEVDQATAAWAARWRKRSERSRAPRGRGGPPRRAQGARRGDWARLSRLGGGHPRRQPQLRGRDHHVGLYGWPPAELFWRLSDAAAVALARVVGQVINLGVLFASTGPTRVALVPKAASGGVRPIGVVASTYRLANATMSFAARGCCRRGVSSVGATRSRGARRRGATGRPPP